MSWNRILKQCRATCRDGGRVKTWENWQSGEILPVTWMLDPTQSPIYLRHFSSPTGQGRNLVTSKRGTEDGHPAICMIWTICGAEFSRDDSGKCAGIVRALYGLRGSAGAFRNHLAKLMSDLGFQSCKADPDVWMRRATKPKDRTNTNTSCSTLDMHLLYH